MNKLEKDIEQTLVRMVKRHGGLCLKWVCPGWSGVPDRIVLLPGGQIMFVELKRPQGGRASKMQKWWERKLRDLGFTHLFMWGHEDLEIMELLLRNGERHAK